MSDDGPSDGRPSSGGSTVNNLQAETFLHNCFLFPSSRLLVTPGTYYMTMHSELCVAGCEFTYDDKTSPTCTCSYWPFSSAPTTGSISGS
jgi:hypothetical protein